MINKFREEYSWLSNFTSVSIKYDNIIYPSVENFYVAMKTEDASIREQISLMTASEAKKIGRKLMIRKDWEDIKLSVMYYGLNAKFQQEPFKSKLIATGDQNIVEGNYWNDTFWGVDLKQDPNIGENHLGRLIMKVRDLIKEEI